MTGWYWDWGSWSAVALGSCCASSPLVVNTFWDDGVNVEAGNWVDNGKGGRIVELYMEA